MAAQKQWGLTPPITLALPTESEKQLTDSLVEELKAQKTFESPEATERRYMTKYLMAASSS